MREINAREDERPERGSNSRSLTLYVGYSTCELLGHAFKSLLKGMAFARTAPLFTNLHKGVIIAPSQNAFDLLLRGDCPHKCMGLHKDQPLSLHLLPKCRRDPTLTTELQNQLLRGPSHEQFQTGLKLTPA